MSSPVICEQCAYENDGRHHFCGMCGAGLPASPTVSPKSVPLAPEASLATISGPSILGLSSDELASDEPLKDSSGVPDETETPHSWGRVAVLFLFISASA